MATFEQCIDYFTNDAKINLPAQKDRLESARVLQQGYAHLKKQTQALALSHDARAVYGLTRLSGTLSAAHKVLQQLAELAPEPPTTILDCGTGPGTVLFAAHEYFPRATKIGVEKERGFIDIASRAVASLMPEAVEQIQIIEGVVPTIALERNFDVAIFSYMLSEIPREQLPSIIEWAIRHSNKYVVIIDAGTPTVSQQIIYARDELIHRGWSILAPCPHSLACPLVAPDFCHFPARFVRSQEVKLVRGRAQSEDEKFCYLIACAPHLARRAETSPARIIKRPMQRKGHCIIDVCTSAGKSERKILSKRDGLAYKIGKKSEWGDVLALRSERE